MKPLLTILALVAILAGCTPAAEQGKADAERIIAKCDALTDELLRRHTWAMELDRRDEEARRDPSKGAAKPGEGALGVPPKTWKTPDSLQGYSPLRVQCIMAHAGEPKTK
jgi:hypothetical protein